MSAPHCLDCKTPAPPEVIKLARGIPDGLVMRLTERWTRTKAIPAEKVPAGLICRGCLERDTIGGGK